MWVSTAKLTAHILILGERNTTTSVGFRFSRLKYVPPFLHGCRAQILDHKSSPLPRLIFPSGCHLYRTHVAPDPNWLPSPTLFPLSGDQMPHPCRESSTRIGATSSWRLVLPHSPPYCFLPQDVIYRTHVVSALSVFLQQVPDPKSCPFPPPTCPLRISSTARTS